MTTIGITGTLGAGKGTVVETLQQEFGFEHWSARRYLTARLSEEKREVNRDTITELANRLRAENGPDYLIRELYASAQKAGRDAVIESIRATGELAFLRRKARPFYFLAVDADPHTRYARIVTRGSETDRVSFEKFLSDEARESNNAEPWKQNLPACIREADFLIMNDGTKEDLAARVREIMQTIAKK